MAGTTRAVPDCSTNHDSADRILVNSYNKVETNTLWSVQCRKPCIINKHVLNPTKHNKNYISGLEGAIWYEYRNILDMLLYSDKQYA